MRHALAIAAASFQLQGFRLLFAVFATAFAAGEKDFDRPAPLLHVGGLGYHPVAQDRVFGPRRLTTAASNGSLLADFVPNRLSSQEMLIASKASRPFSFRDPQEGVPAGDDWTGYSWEVFDQ
jgi:hypothetical protein